jgi:hypothetical protein
VTGPGDRDEQMAALQADVAALRARLSRAEQDAAAARVLARGADRDVADLGGEFREFRSEMRDFRDQNNRVLSAMRADIVDLRGYVDDGFGRIEEQFAQVDRNFLTVRGALDGLAAGQQQIFIVLDALVQRGGDEPTDRP